MPKYVAPAAGEWEMTCPMCETLVRQHWRKVFIDAPNDAHQLLEHVRYCRCGACEAESWWVNDLMVSPRTGIALPPQADMPDDVKDLYEEARTVADLSPRSAAALLRTALETLTREHLGLKAGLNDAIAELVRQGRLDAELQRAMDLLRVTGNGAVHPSELQLDDSLPEAEALFELLNLIVERLVSVPKRIERLYNDLPETRRQQIDARDTRDAS